MKAYRKTGFTEDYGKILTEVIKVLQRADNEFCVSAGLLTFLEFSELKGPVAIATKAFHKKFKAKFLYLIWIGWTEKF